MRNLNFSDRTTVIFLDLQTQKFSFSLHAHIKPWVPGSGLRRGLSAHEPEGCVIRVPDGAGPQGPMSWPCPDPAEPLLGPGPHANVCECGPAR